MGNALPELLSALRRKIHEQTKETNLKLDFTMSQLEALWFIGEADARTMESIASHFSIKPPSATTIVDKLEKAGMVARTRDARDRRVTNVSLTPKARRQLATIRAQKERLFTELVSLLSKKDQKELERILQMLIKN